MRENLTRTLARYRRMFGEFTVGQKAVVLVGTGALLLAGFLVFRWVSTPSYAPLYTNLQSADASSVIDELNKEGVKYKLADGGATIEVPQDAVYSTRINLAGQGLPENNATLGYGILDNESYATSDFQEQTDFKRAMEGELDKTLEAMNGVQTAVVHLAMPEKQVFSDKQDPTTASVLLALKPGTTLSDQQVQAVVHTVAASIDSLDPKNVTVTDQAGNLLTGNQDTTAGLTSTQMDATQSYEDQEAAEIQSYLDGIVGPGNSHVQVNATLNFDQRTTDSTTYGKTKNPPVGSSTRSEEKFSGVGNPTVGQSGVVGPDGSFEPQGSASGAPSKYDNRTVTQDNKIDETHTQTVGAPGGVESQHIVVALDSGALNTIQPAQIGAQLSGFANTKRGDTLDVRAFPFNHSAEQAAQAEIAAAQAADQAAARHKLYRNIGIAAVVALMLLLAWWRARRRAKAREQATTYMVEQLRADAAARAAATQQLELPNAALAALEAAEEDESANLRAELTALVDEQPEDVAALLRGWLVERTPSR